MLPEESALLSETFRDSEVGWKAAWKSEKSRDRHGLWVIEWASIAGSLAGHGSRKPDTWVGAALRQKLLRVLSVSESKCLAFLLITYLSTSVHNRNLVILLILLILAAIQKTYVFMESGRFSKSQGPLELFFQLVKGSLQVNVLSAPTSEAACGSHIKLISSLGGTRTCLLDRKR